METGIPFTLAAPQDTISLGPAETYFVQGADGFDASVRLLTADVSGRDGSVIFPSKRSGLFPILKGLVLAPTPADVHRATQRLRAIVHTMRDEYGVLSWTHSDGSQRQIAVVAADRATITSAAAGAQFVLPLACPTSIKFGTTVHAASVTAPVVGGAPVTQDMSNGGDAAVFPVVRLHGASGATYFTLSNLTYGNYIKLAATVPLGHYLDVDFLNETLYYDGFTNAIRSGAIDKGEFWQIEPGAANSIEFDATWDGTGAAPYCEFFWRDGWA